MNEAMKLAKLNYKREKELAQLQAIREISKTLMTNPIIELVGGFVLVETLQRYPTSRPIIGNLQGNVIEAAIAGIVSVQQLAPSIPYIAQGTSDILGAVSKLAGPALLAAGA
jgi:hypothetical protein